MKLQLQKNLILYYVSVVNWFFYAMVVGCTTIRVPSLFANIWQLVSIFLLALAVFKYTLTRAARNQFLYYLVLLVYLLFVSYHSNYYPLLAWALLVVASRFIEHDRIVRLFYRMHISLLVIVVALALTGVIDRKTLTVVGGEGVRSGFGFSHPNILGMMVFIILLCWCYLHWNRFKGSNIVFIIAVVTGVSILTDSASSVLCIVLIVSAMLFEQWMSKKGKQNLWNRIVYWTLIISVAASIIVMIVYTRTNVFLRYVDYITSGRIRLMQSFYRNYGISLFGRPIRYDNQNRWRMLFALDNSYAHIAIRFGVITLILYVLGLLSLIRRAGKAGDNRVIVCVLILIIYGLFETYFMRAQNNFTLLFVFSTPEMFSSSTLVVRFRRRKRLESTETPEVLIVPADS